MKYFGALLVLAYATMVFSGYEPFSGPLRTGTHASGSRGPRTPFFLFGGK
jgi:hypothetical protein